MQKLINNPFILVILLVIISIPVNVFSSIMNLSGIPKTIVVAGIPSLIVGFLYSSITKQMIKNTTRYQVSGIIFIIWMMGFLVGIMSKVNRLNSIENILWIGLLFALYSIGFFIVFNVMLVGGSKIYINSIKSKK